MPSLKNRTRPTLRGLTTRRAGPARWTRRIIRRSSDFPQRAS